MRATADYRIMQWHAAMDGSWSAEAARRFREQGFDGLVIVPSQDWSPQDLEFLHELQGLRSFSYSGKIKNDLGVFNIDSLEELTLVTGSKSAVPHTVQPRLSRLVLTDRPGITVRSRWPNLVTLRIGEWTAADLRMLDSASTLTSVYLEARRQKGTLDGIQACKGLESLLLVNYSVANTEPLRGLDAISELKLLAAKPTPAHGPLDLSAITSPMLAKLWISNASQLQNVESLNERPALREVRLIGCALTEVDLQALSAFPRQVSVQLVKG